jgi:hypothetical protein
MLASHFTIQYPVLLAVPQAGQAHWTDAKPSPQWELKFSEEALSTVKILQTV